MKRIVYEFYYQRSVVELSQIRHISTPNKLFDVDVVDVAAAFSSFLLFILYISDIHIYLYLYILSDLI